MTIDEAQTPAAAPKPRRTRKAAAAQETPAAAPQEIAADETPAAEQDTAAAQETPAAAQADDVVVKPKSWRSVEITQDCAYGWNETAVQAFIKDWKPVKDYAYIVHDKDFKEDCKTPRNPHIHLLLRFNTAVPTEMILRRAVKVGLPAACITENRLEHIKSWSGAVNYLTHRDENAPHKHVYAPSDVKSNFDWELAASDAHANKQVKITAMRKLEIVDRISDGEWREYQLYSDNSPLTNYELVELAPTIDRALKSQAHRFAIQHRSQPLEVVFITGMSGIGKDVLARKLLKERALDYFVANGSDNPMDDYAGQPAILWSDGRASQFRFRDLLNFLDPYQRSSVKARYRDRVLMASLIVITSVTEPQAWYKDYFYKHRESNMQLFRRMPLMYRIKPNGPDERVVQVFRFDQLGQGKPVLDEFGQLAFMDYSGCYGHDTAEDFTFKLSECFGSDSAAAAQETPAEPQQP